MLPFFCCVLLLLLLVRRGGSHPQRRRWRWCGKTTVPALLRVVIRPSFFFVLFVAVASACWLLCFGCFFPCVFVYFRPSCRLFILSVSSCFFPSPPMRWAAWLPFLHRVRHRAYWGVRGSRLPSIGWAVDGHAAGNGFDRLGTIDATQAACRTVPCSFSSGFFQDKPYMVNDWKASADAQAWPSCGALFSDDAQR